MKKLLAGLLSIMMVMLIFTACGEKKNDKVLTIYTPNSEDLVNAIIPMFEEETGITVEVIAAGTGDCFKRIESEQNNPIADLMWGGSAAKHSSNLELFQDYVSENDKYVVEGYKNSNGKSTYYVLDGTVFIVNNDLAEAAGIEIKGYQDLLQPELKGKIAHNDAAASSSAFAHLTTALLAIGGSYEEQAGWDYMKALLENIGGITTSGSGDTHASVANGEYIVGLTWEDPVITYIREGVNVSVVLPEEGTTYNGSAVAIVKDAKNFKNAKLFVDFLLSKEVQEYIGKNLNNRPVREAVATADYLVPFEDIKLVFEDIGYVRENTTTLKEKYTDIITTIK